MKFLIDRSPDVDWRNGCAHKAMTSRRRGTAALIPVMPPLLDWAANESRVLGTIDTDFGTLLHLRRRAHAGLIRLPDVPSAVRIDLMLGRHDSEDLRQLVITVKGSRIRVSRP